MTIKEAAKTDPEAAARWEEYQRKKRESYKRCKKKAAEDDSKEISVPSEQEAVISDNNTPDQSVKDESSVA